MTYALDETPFPAPDAILILPALLEQVPTGVWVAVSLVEKKVLAFGEDFEEVGRQANALGYEHPLYLKKPDGRFLCV